MGKLKVVTVYSDNFTGLYKVWERSLTRDADVEPCSLLIDLTGFERHGLRTASWYRAAELKTLFFLKILKESEENEVVVFSDCDIQFFNPHLLHEYADLCKTKNIDYLGSKDRSSFSGGFYLVKNSQAVRDFFLNIVIQLVVKPKHKMPFADQDIINETIGRSGLTRGHLAWGTYLMGIQKMYSEGVCFHHAVVTHNTDDKIRQIKEMYVWYYSNWYKNNQLKTGFGYGEVSLCRTQLYFKVEGNDELIYLNNPFSIHQGGCKLL